MAPSKTTTRPKGSEHPSVNLVSLIERFGSEDRCHTYLEQIRWPDGVVCPNGCAGTISRIKTRRQLECDACGYQFSVRVGTVLQDSKLPLWKWFLATYLMVESKKGISANQLKRTLAVSYKTAWYLTHRIRFAMGDDSPEPLKGTVEVDETYIGGRARSGSKKAKGDHGSRNKTMLLGAISRGGEVRLRVDMGTATGRTVRHFIDDSVSDEAKHLYTDQHGAYRTLGDPRHEAVDHSAEEWIRGDVGTQHVESAWSLFKRSIVGSYHQLSVHHLQAYADEFSWRFNNRDNPFLFRDTMRRIVETDPLTFRALTEKRPSERPERHPS